MSKDSGERDLIREENNLRPFNVDLNDRQGAPAEQTMDVIGGWVLITFGKLNVTIYPLLHHVFLILRLIFPGRSSSRLRCAGDDADGMVR